MSRPSRGHKPSQVPPVPHIPSWAGNLPPPAFSGIRAEFLILLLQSRLLRFSRRPTTVRLQRRRCSSSSSSHIRSNIQKNIRNRNSNKPSTSLLLPLPLPPPPPPSPLLLLPPPPPPPPPPTQHSSLFTKISAFMTPPSPPCWSTGHVTPALKPHACRPRLRRRSQIASSPARQQLAAAAELRNGESACPF